MEKIGKKWDRVKAIKRVSRESDDHLYGHGGPHKEKKRSEKYRQTMQDFLAEYEAEKNLDGYDSYGNIIQKDSQPIEEEK
jgi:hypothetical protein